MIKYDQTVLCLYTIHLNPDVLTLILGCPLEVGDVPFDTKEFNFTSHLNAARESFTGRLWLYHDLETLLINSQGNTVGGVVVVGEPGAGKSALSAQLICSRSSNPYIHKRIIGYHLCKYSDKGTQDPGRFVRNLVDLIARRVPEYGMLIYNSSFIPRILQRSCIRDPYECFEQAIENPLRQLKNELRYHFIVIDALDECSSNDAGTPIVQFIKDTYNRLPKWIRLVMTSRNDSAVLKHFSSFPKVHLSPADARNLQDIEIFIATKLFEDASFLERLKVMLGFSSNEEISYLTNKLLSQSQGNFLFAKEMLYFWKDDRHNNIDLNELPKTIGEQYGSYLRRAYGSREKFKPALAILEVLVAAFEPMQIIEVFDVVRIRDKIDYEYDFVYTLKGLSHYIRYGPDNTINLFHLSFIEWLTSGENVGNPYYVSRSRGHRRLAEYYLSVIETTQNSSMDIYRFAQHVSFDEDGAHHLEEFRKINASYINATIDNNNRTLLHLAATKSEKKVLLLLSRAFEDIDCEDSYGFTPAFVAAMNGLVENVKFLVSKGANIEHRTKPPPPLGYIWGDPIERSRTAFWNSTMMHAAASGGHSDVVLLLLKRNASFVNVNGVNLTAIQLAAQNGHLNVVKLLYERGAHLGQLSLQYAAFGGHVDVLAFLLKVGVVDNCMRCDGSFYWLTNRTQYQETSRNAEGCVFSDDRFKTLCQSALHLAVAKNHTTVAKLLLSREDETVHCTDFTGRTPLHEAARQNHVEMAELLIKSGARVSQKCRYFQNFSSSREVRYHLSIQEEIEYNRDLCHCGSTPFLLAARYGHIDVGSLLLRHGVQPHEMDCQGATALHVAACHGHYRFIRWLISQRPSLHVNLRSKNKSTPLHSGAICKNNKDIQPLIDMGASIYDTDQHGMTPLHYSVLNAFEKSVNVMFRTTSSDNIFAPSHAYKIIWGEEAGITVVRDYGVKRNVPCNFQCLKLLEIAKSADAFYINKVDDSGRTTLHLAAQNGEECCVIQLLQKGARTDLTDKKDRTPLDVVVEFAPEELNIFLFDDGDEEMQCANDEESFDLVRTLNLRNHNSVADILLSREAYLTRTCNERQTLLIHRAFEKEKPFIADRILSKGGLLNCKDADGRTALLIYLQNGGKWLDVVLKRFNVTIHIECGKPFNISELHLIAFRKPTVPSDNLLERYTCDTHHCFSEDGPVAKAIKAHPLRFRVIDECRDAEGYTALHRAAQGGNVFVLEKFLAWGADPSLLTPQGHSALDLAIMSGINPFSRVKIRQSARAEKAVDLLFRATRRTSGFDVGCNRAKAKLTVYHLSAYAGLTGFVKTLLNDPKLQGIDVNCSNVHGITPLYLAKLYVGTKNISGGENDPWRETVNLIEEKGGVLTYPSRQVELNVLYKHLFGSLPDPFTLDPYDGNSERFYKSNVSQCREHDLNFYNTSTMVNPHQEAVFSELDRIITSVNKNFQLDPGDLSQLHTLLDARKGLLELYRVLNDVLKGLERTEREITRRRNEGNASSTFPVRRANMTKDLTASRKKLKQDEQEQQEHKQQENFPREISFRHESTKAIVSHMNTYLKKILHKYGGAFGDTKKFVKLLEKYEESELCREEVFQAQMITLKFYAYVFRSQLDDLLSLRRSALARAEFVLKRIPSEWTPDGVKRVRTPPWNQAVKFLYQKATQRDLTYDYLQVLILGSDKDTRILLSDDTLFSL